MATAQFTPSQQRILELLQGQAQPLSAQAIYLRLKQMRQGVGLATVYRALEVLKKHGVIQARVLPSGEAVYSGLPYDRHYFTCLRCNTSIPLQGCPVQNFQEYLRQHHQFRVYYHTLEFFGLCPNCQDSA
ncbi:Fur family transcriptional regulator [Gloeomargarita sp.]